MGNKEYLNVNELATLFGLKVQTLHYYDKIGILKPSYRDPNNGYRKYRFDQTYKLASIRYMRKLGYSIEESGIFRTPKILTKHCSVLKNVLQLSTNNGKK